MPSEMQREILIQELVSALGPMIANTRPEVVDYNELTFRLSQAVKPHISQLIDLASDKRETASLIVNSLLPLLPGPHAIPTLDTDAIASHLSSEIRKALAPMDAFEIKEQVADLVVERLDSRLAVRDKAFNVDSLTTRITETLSHLLDPMQQVNSTMGAMMEGHSTLTTQSNELVASQKDMTTLLEEFPHKLDRVFDAVDAAKSELLAKPQVVTRDTAVIEAIAHVESGIDTLTGGQKSLAEQNEELLNVQHDLLERLTTLPDVMVAATSVLQNMHAEFGSSRDASKNDQEEIKRLKNQNQEMQVQLAKARGAHGQVRVEKDSLVEKVQFVEAERNRSNSQLEEAKAAATAQTSAAAATEARKAELEIALAQALERLKTSDAASQIDQARITELEKVNQDHDIKERAQLLEVSISRLSSCAANKFCTIRLLLSRKRLLLRCTKEIPQSTPAEFSRRNTTASRLNNNIGKNFTAPLSRLRPSQPS